MKTYSINLLEDNAIKEIKDIIKAISSEFLTDEFKQFIADKCQVELERICIENLNDLNDPKYWNEKNTYMNGMFVEIVEDRITLGNDSIVDINSKNMNPETKARYSSELSLAKIVEFGVGSLGTSDETWQVNINQQEHLKKYGKDGWYYLDDNGNLHWTKGIKGKLIFYKLEQSVYENISDWISEYIMRDWS